MKTTIPLAYIIVMLNLINVTFCFGIDKRINVDLSKSLGLFQTSNEGNMVVYFVEKNGIKTGKQYSYKFSLGEDTSDARRKIKNTYASEWGPGESLGYGAHILKPGESMLVYSCFFMGKRRVNPKKYVSENNIFDFIVKQKARKGYQFKELKRIITLKRNHLKK